MSAASSLAVMTGDRRPSHTFSDAARAFGENRGKWQKLKIPYHSLTGFAVTRARLPAVPLYTLGNMLYIRIKAAHRPPRWAGRNGELGGWGVRQPLPAAVAERLEALRNRPIEPTEKGFCALAGGQDGPVTAARLATAKPPLHAAGFSYPLLTLRQAAVRNNVEAMAAYCAAAGVELAPHGKTAMSPELAALQLSHGAWAITVATIGQLRTYRDYGFNRLLLASELVDKAGIAWLAAELAAHPDFEPYCFADNPNTIENCIRISPTASPHHPLSVLIELGHDGGRTGCRTDAEAIEVAKAV